MVFELALVLIADVLRLGAQGVLHAGLALLDPFLDLGGRKIELPGGLGDRRLPLNDFQHQRALAPCRPTFDLVVHRNAHRLSPQIITPEQKSTGSLQ